MRVDPSFRQQQQAIDIIRRQRTATQKSMEDAVAHQNKIAATHEPKPAVDVYKDIKTRLDKAMELAAEQNDNDRRLKAEMQKLFLDMENHQLRIRYLMEMDRMVVQLVERGSGKVRYQYPSARIINLERLARYMPGVFLNQINVSM